MPNYVIRVSSGLALAWVFSTHMANGQDRGAPDFDPQSHEGCELTALMRAAKEGQNEVVRDLLEAGADPNESRTCSEQEHGQGQLPSKRAVELAARAGHARVVFDLLRGGASPGDALPWALVNGDDLVVAAAVWEGADLAAGLTLTYGDACTPLTLAVMRGRPEWIRRLLRNGADPNVENEETCDPWTGVLGRVLSLHNVVELLATAKRRGVLPLSKGIAEFVVDPRETSGWAPGARVPVLGGTPLMWAATIGDVEAVEALLEGAADPNYLNDYGMRPVDLVRSAVEPRTLEVLSGATLSAVELLARGATDPEHVDATVWAEEKASPDLAHCIEISGVSLREVPPEEWRREIQWENKCDREVYVSYCYEGCGEFFLGPLESFVAKWMSFWPDEELRWKACESSAGPGGYLGTHVSASLEIGSFFTVDGPCYLNPRADSDGRIHRFQ